MGRALREKAWKDDKQDLLAELIELHRTKPEFKEIYLRRMAMTNLGAGHETLCSALTSIVTMVGAHPDVQRKIAEASEQSPHALDGDGPLCLPPYIEACIKEAQRLYPVIGMSLPRRVPAQGLRIQDHYFPPGTTVGCNPVSLHRNEDIFGEDAMMFHPERWLGSDPAHGGADAKTMQRYNLTWGEEHGLAPASIWPSLLSGGRF